MQAIVIKFLAWICLAVQVQVVRGDVVFRIPTPFLVKSSRQAATTTAASWIATAADVRGGSDSVYEEDDEEETWEEEEEDEYDEAVAEDDAILRDSNLSSSEEGSFEEEEEEEFVHVEEAGIFDVEEEDIFVDAQQVFGEAPGDQVSETDESSETFDVAEAAETGLTQVHVLEERMMAGTTDDENSSAFVDRMELADAYDEGETTAAGDDTAALAAVTAATAVGGGSDETDEIRQGENEAATAVETRESMEITDEMKQILQKELKFKARDVKVLRPDIAAMVVANRLRRPIEGMPPNWYIGGASPISSNSGFRNNVVKVSVTLVVVGTVALVGLRGDSDGFDLDSVQEAFKKFPALLATVPAAFQSAVSSKGSAVAALPPAKTPVVATPEEPVAPVEEEGKGDEEEEDHPHSVKPGATHAPAYEADLDRSLLDKVITKIENVVKAFFRIKI